MVDMYICKLAEIKTNKQTDHQKRFISVGIILNTLALVVARKQSSRKERTFCT